MIKIAAVQTAPVFMNTAATVDKTCNLIAEAASNGARLVAFPEVFIPAYPYWAWLEPPIYAEKWYQGLYQASLEVPGPWTDKLCDQARKSSITVVVGINEIEPKKSGTIYNTNLVISHEGKIIGKHRKLVPTYAEKLIWGRGDGSSYKVYDTPAGRIGTLNCGENTHTLARYALIAQGEQVHIANFPAFPFANWYKESEAIKIRCQAHAFEGKLFVMSSTSLVDEDCLKMVCDTKAKREIMGGKDFALTAIWGPDGQYLCDPLIDEEGIVYADINLENLISPRQIHDITGHYTQPEVLSLRLNKRSPNVLEETED